MAMTNVSGAGDLERLHQLSPFELKDELIRLARDDSQGKARTDKMLNAGRGNPNWVATTPREAFFLLGQFALTESKRVWDEPGFGGMPRGPGSAQRLFRFLENAGDSPGATMLHKAVDYGVRTLGFAADAFVHELCDSIIGDNYPTPDRMLHHAEAVVHRYLQREMCDDRPPPGRYDLFATEGGTAAMCYIFNSLIENQVLHRGDTIALGTPIFTPYIEIAHLNDFDFQTISIEQSEIANGRHAWQYPEGELDKLTDPRIKAFFVVNPSNPASFAMRQESIDQLVRLVRTKRPDLLLITDDVYGTFVPHYRSLAADLPRNTILVYSYSKHFGCTGWRLGVVALHEDNVIDEMIARLPAAERQVLARRYGSLTTTPGSMKFIDRMVADSRAVALNHTAGLSLPQQVQMTLFSLFALLDDDDQYKKRCREIVHSRLRTLADALGVDYPEDDLRAGYYVDLDLGLWGRENVGPDFADYLAQHHDPLEIVLLLARRYGTVLLNGSGFDGPPWSVRVSLANLDADDYAQIGDRLEDVIASAVTAWKAHRSAGGDGNGNGRGNGSGTARR